MVSGAGVSTASATVEANRFTRDGKLLVGKDGWLFLDNDTNHVVRQHTGDLLFSPVGLRRWQLVLENRTAWVERMGARYFFVVPPNPHTVYPEKMPDDLPLSAQRPVTQLMEHLASERSFARVLYLLDAMLAAKRTDFELYTPVDTHWNGRGAFVGYKLLMDEVEKSCAVRRITDDVISYSEHEQEGDLGHKVDPPRTGRRAYAHILNRASRLVADNCVEHTGRMMLMECEEAPPTTCVVCGDSYSYTVLPLLAESFRRLVFAQVPTLDRDLIRKERPDVVISIVNERFLLEPPNDHRSPSTTEIAAVKLAQGRATMPNMGPLWAQEAPLRDPSALP